MDRRSVGRVPERSSKDAFDEVRATLLELAAADHAAEELTHRIGLQPAIDDLKVELRRANEIRAGIAERLPAGLAVQHRLLRRTERFPCICGVERARCVACNVQLPTLLAQRLTRTGTEVCPNCKRILSDVVRRTRTDDRE